MNVFVVGFGAREHALILWLLQSLQVTHIWITTGNAGTARLEKVTNLPIHPEDIGGIVVAAQDLSIDLVVVGPDVPLAMGLVDRLREVGIRAFGPTEAAAQIEASKIFSTLLMREALIPHPESWILNTWEEALAFLRDEEQCPYPVYVKPDGLTGGKGVELCNTKEKAIATAHAYMVEGTLGEAGRRLVVQRRSRGTELSAFVFSDGENVSDVMLALDYKRLKTGDEGDMTGSMGSSAPPHFWTARLANQIGDTIMQPAIDAMKRRGTPFAGVLYAGLMLTEDGPEVLEFNCRWGDSEAQAVLRLIVGDPILIMLACIEGRLQDVAIALFTNIYYVAVVIASHRYPEGGDDLTTLWNLDKGVENTEILHGRTRVVSTEGMPDQVVSDGGRMLTVLGWGAMPEEAHSAAYERVRTVGAYPLPQYRDDVGTRESRPYVGRS